MKVFTTVSGWGLFAMVHVEGGFEGSMVSENERVCCDAVSR